MDDKRSAPIGVFDSGIGGLTVAREIMRNLPNEKIVYFGDTARVPYGSKSQAVVRRYSRQIVRFLKTQGIKAIVVACNTASAYALEDVREEAGDMPVIGVVEPGAKVAAETTKNGRIGVMATKATISSGAYTRAIWDLSRSAEVFGVACPMLVPLVEEGWIHDEVTDTVLRRYLAPLFEEKVDTLILGCTHYPLLRSAIARVVGDDICLVNPAYETARALGELLVNEGLDDPEKPRKDEPTPYRFFVSDEAERFTDFASMILPIDVKSARLIQIEKY